MKPSGRIRSKTNPGQKTRDNPSKLKAAAKEMLDLNSTTGARSKYRGNNSPNRNAGGELVDGKVQIGCQSAENLRVAKNALRQSKFP